MDSVLTVAAGLEQDQRLNAFEASGLVEMVDRGKYRIHGEGRVHAVGVS